MSGTHDMNYPKQTYLAGFKLQQHSISAIMVYSLAHHVGDDLVFDCAYRALDSPLICFGTNQRWIYNY